MSNHREFRFPSSDGLQIACNRWQNRGPVRGIVQIAHGLGEHVRDQSLHREALWAPCPGGRSSQCNLQS
jgi:alpha-beta hydrolase superfamily lysophospholipase